MSRLYTPVTVVVALLAAIVGDNSFSSLLCQAAAVGIIAFRKDVKAIVTATFRRIGNPLILTGLIFVCSIYLGLGPMAPVYLGHTFNHPFLLPLLGIGIVYLVIVVWKVNGWDINRYAGTEIDNYTGIERAKFPHAKGWAKPDEVIPHFSIGQTPVGIHIGNGLHWNGLGHILTVGGAGQGKGTCLVLPALLSDGLVRAGTSIVCLDPKGENAAVSAPHLRRAGYEVHVINPFNIQEVAHLGNSRWDPFSLVEMGEEKPFCDALAMAIHNRKSGGDNEFFNARCRQYISLYARYVIHFNKHVPIGEEESPLMTQLYYLLLQSGKEREVLLSNMATDDGFTGKKEAEAILSRVTSNSVKTEDAIYSTIEEAMNILDNRRLQASMSVSDFELRHIAEKPMAIFICVRHDELRYYAMWLRLFTDMLLKTLNKYYNPQRKVLVLLDEFAQLGYVDQFAHAPAILRGYNVTLWPIVQHIGQLQQTYGREGFETFIGNSVIKHWFGGNGGAMDNATADYIIKRLPTTVEILRDDRGKPYGKERPVLDFQGVINYPNIIGEASGVRAFEIYKTPYWDQGFAKTNASKNPFYNK